MAYIPRSSLIPSVPGQSPSAIPQQVKRRRTVHIFNLLSSILLVVALLGVGGTIFYTSILEKRLETAKINLNALQASNNFDDEISEIRAYYAQLITARRLLDNHLAVSKIFDEIEDVTKKSVQFESFEYSYEPGFEATVSLSGSTDEFASLALQKMQLASDNIFAAFAVQEISKSTESLETTTASDGEQSNVLAPRSVKFGVQGLFKKELLEYRGTASDVKGETKQESPIKTESVSVPVDIPQGASSTASSTNNTTTL